jgi:hypothetical protein
MTHRLVFFVLAAPIMSVWLLAQDVQLLMTPGNLPQGQQGNIYGQAFAATGGTTPYSWSVAAGSTPPGIAMDANGNFVGTPTAVGAFHFTAMVTDANNNAATGNFSVNVAPANGYDGPAQLPIATVASSMADTPAPGAVVTVNAGANLQAALKKRPMRRHNRITGRGDFYRKLRIPGPELRQQSLDHCSHQRSRQQLARRGTAGYALLCGSSFSAGASPVLLQQSAECAGQTRGLYGVERTRDLSIRSKSLPPAWIGDHAGHRQQGFSDSYHGQRQRHRKLYCAGPELGPRHDAG